MIWPTYILEAIPWTSSSHRTQRFPHIFASTPPTLQRGCVPTQFVHQCAVLSRPRWWAQAHRSGLTRPYTFYARRTISSRAWGCRRLCGIASRHVGKNSLRTVNLSINDRDESVNKAIWEIYYYHRRLETCSLRKRRCSHRLLVSCHRRRTWGLVGSWLLKQRLNVDQKWDNRNATRLSLIENFW